MPESKTYNSKAKRRNKIRRPHQRTSEIQYSTG